MLVASARKALPERHFRLFEHRVAATGRMKPSSWQAPSSASSARHCPTTRLPEASSSPIGYLSKSMISEISSRSSFDIVTLPSATDLDPSCFPSVVEEESADPGCVDTCDVLGCGGQEVVKVGVDDRRLVQKEPLDLTGDAPLRR